MSTEIVAALLSGGGVAAVIGVFLARMAVRYAWLKGFLERFRATRRAVVLEIEQTYVDARARGRLPESPGGVELTPAEQREALSLAVERLQEMVGLKALERALGLMGLPTMPDFVRNWLVTWVESTVKELSIEQAAANGTSAVKTAVVAAAVVRASAEFRLPMMPQPPPRPGP